MKIYEIKPEGATLRLFVYLTLMAVLLLLSTGAVAQAAPAQQDAPAEPVSAAAVGTIYNVTSTSCTGPGSMTEAMALANANPGEDTIKFTPGLQIDVSGCPLYPRELMLHATESVIFEGNGAKLGGHINIQPTITCPLPPSSVTYSDTPGFIRVGNIGQDNSAITVTVSKLDMFELHSVARIEKKASLILEDLSMDRIISHIQSSCATPAILAYEGANFTARRTKWSTIVNFYSEVWGPDPLLRGAAILNAGGGDLTIEDSEFLDVVSSGVIRWNGPPGSELNIVSSRFDRTGGILIDGDVTTNIVNTIWAPASSAGGLTESDRLINFSSGPMNIVASTLLLPDLYCNSLCQSYGLLQRISGGGGLINFKQSAVGVNFPLTGQTPAHPGKLLAPDNGSYFSADIYTWMQPTAWQNAAALKTATNQPNLLTGSPALLTTSTYPADVWATPLDPGELIDIVPDAQCGQANQLLNPIDNSCITVDALGNPRVDANGKRNSGAVQLTLAPHLTVTGTGDQTVDLSWTKPQFSHPTTGIKGYELRYRATGAGSWEPSIDISGPDTRTHQVTNLTSGTEYEFEVRATYEPGGEGPWSNNVTGRPLGPIGAPVVTATPGNTQVDLSWTKPDDGGHVINSYSINWRPVGTTNIIGFTQIRGTNTSPPATQKTIKGLTNGTEYEFFVFARSAFAGHGPSGTDTATPFGPGTIRIYKSTHPGGGAGFSFSQDIDASGDFMLDDDGHAKVFNIVTPGTYTVTEADPEGVGAGYTLSSIVCIYDDPNGTVSFGDVATRTATINLDPGESAICSFSNAEEETVVIEKRTVPPGGSGFTFSDDIGTPNIFSLGDAETRPFTHVQPGDYQVTEDEMPGYELTAIDCTVEGQSVPGDLDTRTADISLTQPGGSAYCRFTNTQLGTIIMRKETLPDGAPDAFDYTITGPDFSDSGSLVDGEFKQVDNAQPGTWTLAETMPGVDWHLGDISCTSTLGTSGFDVDPDNLKTTVELAPGDTMECTFTNVEDETITVEKVTVPAGDTTTVFGFDGSGSIGQFALLDGEKKSFSVDAEAGPYILTESDPSGTGYELTKIRCVNSQTGEITLGDPFTRTVVLDTQPGESQHCTFTNERHGQVVIRKATAPAGDTTNSFGFYGSFGSFSLKDGKDKTIIDVRPGTYSVSEVDPTSLGYGLSGIRCTDSDPNGTPSTSDLPTHTATLNVDAGETVECTFTNSEFDTVSVRKTTFPADGTGFGFDGSFGPFTLDDGDLKSFEVASGNYTISEDDPAPGYDLILAFCYDALTGQFYEGDLEKRQVDLLDLEEGHQILCEFVNVQRGKIIIEKADGAGTGYAFSGDLGDFSLDSGKEETFELPVGQYLVTEQTPPGDRLIGLTCTDDDPNGVASTGDVALQTATINLDPGETVRCTYTNEPGGSIVIKKVVSSGLSGPFTFLDNIQTPATFDLSDGGEQRFDGILPGTYTVQETGFPTGSGLDQLECVDSDASGTPSDGDLSTATAIIHLDPGETVECTFTNALCVAPQVPAVSIAATGTQVMLSWPGGTSNYYGVFRSSNAPYFTPALPPYDAPVTSPWLDLDSTSIGDVANNYFYVVQATNVCLGTVDSNRVGEFDFSLLPGTP